MHRLKLFPSEFSRTRKIAISISIFIVLVLSVLDVIGWLLNINLLKSLVPQWEPMTLSSAICFIFAVSALLIILSDSSEIIRKVLPMIFAAAICCISLISIYVHFYTFSSGHESSITLVSFLTIFLSKAERMSFMTACNSLLLGGALILLFTIKERLFSIAMILIIPAFLISYFTIISYILDVNSLIELSHLSIPLNTSIAFCGISTSVLLMRPDSWFLRPIISHDTAGMISRRLLLPLIVLPIVIGWMRIQGERFGLFESEEGVVGVTIIYNVCFLALVWLTARSVNKIDIQRKASEKALREREAQLTELNATKDKFFNIVAHDLKNPFTSLLGSSELLYHNIGNLEPENIRELALILNDSAKSGYAILQNLLDWSRSQTGLLKINPERVNLKNLIHENISTLQLAATNKQILISNEVKKDFFVFSDKNMINTILRNLLSNAVKYTYKSGQVRVTTTITTDEVIVSIKDTGIGIPADIIEKLFKIESRNSIPGTENELGTGLGLKLSKEFVEKLGGRIWVESVEKIGSDFRFSIPRVEA
ncbi:MAG: HAMP domain-containing sensor histidine kinase [Bacteroidales bacterium]